MMRRALPLLAFALVTLAAGTTQAQIARGGGRKIQGIRPDVHLNLGFDEFGVGFRIDIPIVPDGFLTGGRVDDELAISPGLDLMFFDFDNDHDFCHDHGGRGRHCHDDDEVGIWPVVVVQWNLYINDKWSVFPELGIAFLINDGYHDHDHNDDFSVTVAASFGARFHFNERLSLLMRLNWPCGLQIGLTF